MSTSEITTKAFFVSRPRALNDLVVPHLVENEQRFYIRKRIALLPHDYENFVTDFLVEREYIEKADSSCTNKDNILECLFVTQMNKDEGVLVVPDDNGFVKLAASYKSSNCYNTPNYLYGMKSTTRKTRRAYSNRRVYA